MNKRTLRQFGAPLGAALFLLTLPLAAAAQTVEVDPEVQKVDRRVMVVRGHGDEPHAFAYSMGHRAFLGVTLLDLTPELRRHFGVGEEEGVLISSVEAESPAAQAGLAAGDILVAIDGESVDSSREIVHAVGSRGEGEVVELQLMREGQLQVFSATLAERQRPEVDISRWAWSTDGGETHGFQFLCEDDEDCPEVLNIDPELMEGAASRIREHLGSPHFQQKMLEFHEGNEELEGRLEELEKRLEELQRQLGELEK